MSAYDTEIERAMMRGEDPVEHVLGLTWGWKHRQRIAVDENEDALQTLLAAAYSTLLVSTRKVLG